MNIFSPELKQLAQQLAQYERSTGFHSILSETAYQQIVVDGGIIFPHNAEQIKKALLFILTDRATEYDVQLWDKTNDQDFKWELYDRCKQFCEQYDLDPIMMYGLHRLPKKPESFDDALEYFTVSELKEILRTHHLKVSGSRQELVERVQENLSLEQFQPQIEQKYQEKFEHERVKYVRKKYELLIGFLLHRFYFLRQITQQYSLMNDNIFMKNYRVYPCLEFIDANNDEEKTLANFLIPNGFDNVVVHQQVRMLLPLFPSDRSQIVFRRERITNLEPVTPVIQQQNSINHQPVKTVSAPQSKKHRNKSANTKNWLYLLYAIIAIAVFALFLR